VFPEYFVFGNERSFQREADIFAVNGEGDLVVFELKVAGEYDRGKIYQALEYSQLFSRWEYSDMNAHYKKCYPNHSLALAEAFENHFGYRIDIGKYNRNQKIIVISNGSSLQTQTVSQYWKGKGIDIEEYYYRIYEIAETQYFELSTELYVQNTANHCWINTCEKYIKGAYLDMVKNQKASAYGDVAWVVNESMKSSFVFLYLNGYGIVGAGVGTATIRDNGQEGDDRERYIVLKDFVHGVDIQSGRVERSILPFEIKKMLNRDFWFATTRVPLSDENAKTLFEKAKSVFLSKT
ncbi:MAG: hypothetical protein BWK80_57110, partial [Desulfobacteraceae bacterium IS3]